MKPMVLLRVAVANAVRNSAPIVACIAIASCRNLPDSGGPHGQPFDWLGQGDTERSWALDEDADGVSNLDDPCPGSPHDATPSAIPGCAVVDVTAMPDSLLAPVSATLETLGASLADRDDLEEAARLARGGHAQLIWGARAVEGGMLCDGAGILEAARGEVGSAVATLEARLAQKLAESTAQAAGPAPADASRHAFEVIDLDRLRELGAGAHARVQTLAAAASLACDAARPLAEPVRGRIAGIDWANRRLRVEDHATFRLPESFAAHASLQTGIEVEIDGVHFEDGSGVVSTARPIGEFDVPIEPQTFRCLHLRLAPLQRFPPYAVRPLVLHDPAGYRAGDEYRVEIGMALGVQSSCAPETEAAFASHHLRLELAYVATDGASRSFVITLHNGDVPVPLPRDMRVGERADLRISTGYYGCMRSGHGLATTRCSTKRIVIHEETLVLDVSAPAGRCTLAYDATELEVDDRYSSWDEFRPTRVTNFVLLHPWDAGGAPVLEAEGYAAWQSPGGNWQTTYPRVYALGQRDWFAIRNSDFTSIHPLAPGAVSHHLATGVARAAGLRWPHVTGRNNGAEFRFACDVPRVVRDVVDFCPGGNAYYRYPFDWREERYRQGQGPNGLVSHRGMYAYDMNAPAGIDILAARAGVVEALFEDAYLSMFGENSAVCGVTGPAACRNNYVIIRHQDGSQARYAHMIHQGVFVDVGDVVRRGQLIGAVGSTGYSTGPHLHFDVWSPDAVLDIASGNTTLLPRWQARDPDNEEEGLYCYELPNAEGNSIDMRSTNERWP